MMDIFTTKESALVHLNSTRIAAGEIKVYRYYSTTGGTDSFVVIGLQDGIGPDCYQILSKRKNLIVNIDDELPDSSRLIQGQIHVCPINGVYHMVYIEDSQRIIRKIPDSEVYYVEDFDSGYMYYLDRYTCKKLDDYFSKVYIDLSNTNALYEAGKYPETTITVWKDNADITSACQIGITTVGCNAIYDGSKTVRVTGMTERTAKVVIKVIYRGNTYQETWNIQKVQEGIKGADAEIWSVLSKNSFIREPDLQTTTFQILYQSGSELSHLEVPSLQNYGLRLTYEYSNGEVGSINTQDFEFEPRIFDDNTELTFCIVRLLNQESEVLSAITLPYLPNTSTLSSGQGVYKAIVFCRSNEMPETPLGGSWDTPIPTTGQWSQVAPDGPEVLWTSTRIFTTDAKTPQDATWSVPSRISNTENLEVMYSTCQDSTIVGTPSTKPENWEAVVTGIAYFMATRTIINGVPGLWQVFAIHGVDGEASDYKNYIYYNSVTKPETPVGSHPVGWTDFPDTDGIWWMCVGLFSGRTNELVGIWSNPVKISGLDGEAGQGAPYLIYQYSVGTSPVDAPTYNWSSSIPSVPRGMYLWQRSGTVIPPSIAPTSWNIPIRITGEQGKDGAPGTSITIDLTNEVSSVAADYEGNVVAAATFETTQVLLYRNGKSIDLGSDENVRSITITSDGVRASVSKSGLVTIHTWTAPKDQDTATVVVNVNYNYNTYTAIYSIQKVKAGSPGKDAVLYSIIPSTNVLRKVNSVISPKLLTTQVRKAVGSKLSNITDLDSEGLVLEYTVNGARNGETYDFVKGIETKGVEYVTLTLKSNTTGSVIDKETILTMESTLDLIVDLTNEVSAIAASEDGALNEYTNFEKSKVRVYYGSEQVNPKDCQIKTSWSNMTGEFNPLTGVITPTGWDPNKLNESTGQCVLEVTYKEFTKSVTYTVTKVNSGETPVLYRLMPSASVVKTSATSLSVSTLRCDVWEIVGKTRYNLELDDLTDKKLRLVYRRRTTNLDESDYTNQNYSSEGVKMNSKIEEVTFYLYDITNSNRPQLLDQETVPVVKDGTNAYAVVVDLTNESSCVAADSEGVVPEGAYFESTKLLVYRNGAVLKLDDPIIGQIELECSGVTAEIDKNGIITVKSWVAPASQKVANIEITVSVDGVDYKCIYSITKVNAGASGESPVIYSLMPSTNIIRKFNGKPDTNFIFVGVLRTQGLEQRTVHNGQEGLDIKYTKNSGDEEIQYTDSGIPISDSTEQVQIILKNESNTVIDRETIIVVETAVDLVIDLTNDASAIAADSEGNILNSENFETSTVQVYYGPNRIDFSDPRLQAEATWTGLDGSFSGGLITPTQWKTTDDVASVTIKVSYEEYVKTVTYTVTRIKAGADGETPVIWRIIPDVTSIKATATGISRDTVAVDVYKIIGTSRLRIMSDQFKTERISLVYSRTFISTGIESERDYQDYIPITNGVTGVEISLYDSERNVLDRESVPVVYDGSTGAKPDWKDYIFCTFETQPNTPTFTEHPASGTADNSGCIWWDGPDEQDGSTWWMSVATIYGESPTNELVSGTSWSKPIRVTGIDGTGYECEYTNSKNLVIPPVSSIWSKAPSTPPSGFYTWMRMRSTENEAWSYMRITGERGSDGNSIIVKGNLVYAGNDIDKLSTNLDTELMLIGGSPYSESDDSYNGLIYQGQNPKQASSIANGDCFLYKGRFFICTGVDLTDPSKPINTFQAMSIQGIQGDPGESWITYIAYSKDSQGTVKSKTWKPGYNYMGVAVVTYADHADWESVSVEEYSWARFHGQDGIGQEFIFIRTKTEDDLFDQSPASIETDSTNENGVSFQSDEYLPNPDGSWGKWSDNPVELNSEYRIQWISQRKKTNGVWGSFSPPVVWSRYGTGISIKGVLQYVGSNNVDQYQDYILTDSYTPGSSISICGKLYREGREETSVAYGDTYSYDGNFFICVGSTPDTYDWSIMKAKGDDGRSSYVFIRYSATGNTSDYDDMSDTWKPGMNFIGIATSTQNQTLPDKSAFKWAKFQGQDGVGQEFIYCLSDELTDRMREVANINPSTSADSVDSGNSKAFQDDNFLPSTQLYGGNDDGTSPWTDDPQEVSEQTGERRQWVSHRVKRNGEWGRFSVPTLWSEKLGAAFNLTLGNQSLEAIFSGTGVVRPSVAHDSIEAAIVDGNCAGTTVSYLKGDARIDSTYTLMVSYGGQTKTPEIVVYIYSNEKWQIFNVDDPSRVLLLINVPISNFEIFVSCGNKNINQWTVTIESADHVSKTLTVTRTSFAPSISLGVSSYAYNMADDGTITYTPSKTTSIGITYLGNGKLTTLDAFKNYGYYVHARYVGPDGSATTWMRITTNPTLGSIVGAGNDPSSGSIEFEVSDAIDNNQGFHQVFCRATISIVASADLESVKTFLLNGNAAITGHLWAKDGKVGNWIINALDNSAGGITYGTDGNGESIVIASYDDKYPSGSLRSSDGTIVFDPSSSPSIKIKTSSADDGTTNTIVLDKTGLSTKWWTTAYDSGISNHIGVDGSGYLANESIKWTTGGGVEISGKITATSGSIGGWSIGGDSISKSINYGPLPGTNYTNFKLSASDNKLSIFNQRIINETTPEKFDISISAGTKETTPCISLTQERQNHSGTNKATVSISPDGFAIDKSVLQYFPESPKGNTTPIYFSSDGSGWLASGNISWDENGAFHIGLDNKDSDGYYKYGLDLTEGYLRIGGKRGDYEHQYFTVDMTDTGPSVTISTTDDGYHGAGGSTTTFDNKGMQTTGQVDCDGLSITSYSADHKSHASLTVSYGLIVADDTTDLSSPYSQVTKELVKTPKVIVGKDSNNGCYITSTNPLSGVYVTRIGANTEIFLESDVTIGDFNSGSYRRIIASAFSQSSDERFKTKISDITLTSEQISKAPAIVYHWNTDEAKTRRAGTIAQYWQNILPEVVVEDDNGNLSLNYSELSTVSVISLAKEIVALKAKIKELENK